MYIETRSSQSVFSYILQSAIRPFKPHLVTSDKICPTGSPKLTPHRCTKRLRTVVERKIDDIWTYDLSHSDEASAAQTETDSPKLHIYYFAGGGWQGPPSSQHWRFCTALALSLRGCVVTVVSPPLAPKSPASVTMPILSRLYNLILEQSRANKDLVVLAGDSSGGNLVLCLALRALTQDPGLVRPRALLVISPAVDLRPMKVQGELRAIAKKDPVLTVSSHNAEAKTWACEEDPAEYWISPATADSKLLSEAGIHVIGVTGGWDILSPDAIKFREAARQHGLRGAWLHWEKQMHCFPLAFMYRLPEAVQAKDWIVEQLQRL
ncbi:Hormone-sensitive lipase [Sphaceloma murrayae]|uniref:Hormone-sensitive lipase n=1 Tax=Sphaceloma murrayae TaxID=2082308 RepID=A0A2K1QNE9_9PEZI|nr:Hormone-sensitive lipase [Sphaceloma murrayae]